MSEIKKLILSVLALALIIVVAVVGYNYLSEKYAPAPALPGTSDESDADTSRDTIPAVDFTVYDADGNEITLFEKLRLGKPVVLNFWATWCGPCKMELPHFEKAYNEFGDKVEFMMINLTDGDRETKDKVLEFIEEKKYTFPVYFDTALDAGMTYGTNSIPVSVFIDAEGNIVYGYIGAMSKEMLYACIDLIYKQ